tara:strand:- start:408 stop:1160 length:753 start_codon:yes stop_codon:yes gene_type:complete
MNTYDLNGRTAVVTGGSRGIGLAIVQRLSSSGANVIIWDIDPIITESEKSTVQFSSQVESATVDVTNPTSIDAAVQKAVKRFGNIDILVNNAGISGPNLKTWEYPIEDWHQVLAVDLTGVFFCCRAVVPVMLENRYGRIVNVASIAGKEGNPNAPAYSAAKAGVIGLTKSLGKELSGTDIRANCVTPAGIKTDIFDQMTKEHIDYMLSKIPMGRFGKVEEVAAMVAWLASDECTFSTGGVFDISGGRATY